MVTLVFAEVALRLVGIGAAEPGADAEDDGLEFFAHHPVLGWDLVPGTSDRHESPEFGVSLHISEQGLRSDRVYDQVPPPGVRRAVVLGDSFTFGHGVEVEQGWTARVESAMPDLELVNLAVTGYGVDQMVLRLEQRSTDTELAFRPHLVIAAIFVADVFRVVDDVYMGYRKPHFVLDDGAADGLRLVGVPVPPKAPEPSGPLFGSRLAGLFAGRAVPLMQHLGFGASWPITGRLLERLRVRTEAAGARLAVVVLPKDRAVLDGGLRSDVNRRATRELDVLLDDLGIPYLDLTQSLAAHAESAPDVSLYYPGDGHWTAAGHRVAAETIAEWLPAFLAEGEPR